MNLTPEELEKYNSFECMIVSDKRHFEEIALKLQIENWELKIKLGLPIHLI